MQGYVVAEPKKFLVLRKAYGGASSLGRSTQDELGKLRSGIDIWTRYIFQIDRQRMHMQLVQSAHCGQHHRLNLKCFD